MNSFLKTTLAVIMVVSVGVMVFYVYEPKVAEAGWYATGGTWSYRKVITINNGKVEGTSDLTNFPILVDLTDADLATYAQADGDDILFTSADGTTKLDHEIELYTTATGRLTAWVRIPTLDFDDNTVIYMYYGNGSASNQQNVTGTWNSNYKGVWHFKEGFTSDLTTTDSTSNNNDLNSAGSYSASSNGKIDGGALQGGTSYMNTGTNNPLDGLTAFTIEAYIYNTSGASGKAFMSDWTSRQLLWRAEGSNQLRLLIEWTGSVFDTSAYSPSGYANNTWTKVVATYDGTTVRTYSNGVAGYSAVDSGKTVKTATGSNTFNFGGGPTGSEDFWVGSLDEFRVSDVARSAGWITTEYNNQSATSTFYTISSAQASQPADVKIRGGGSATNANTKIRGGAGGGGVKFR